MERKDIKIMLLCVVSVLFYSCRIIKQIDFVLKGNRMDNKTVEIYNYGKKIPFILDENTIFIPCKINDTMHLLYYVSKIGGFMYENISGNTEFPKCSKTIKVRMKNSQKQDIVTKVGLKHYDIESDFFHFKNFVGLVTSVSNDTITPKCMSEKDTNRFAIGRNAFPNRKATMLFNFSDTTITLLDTSEIYDTVDFTLIKSLEICTSFTVCLTVDSIEYAFLFDTDFEGFLALPHYEKHKKENDISVASYIKQDDTNILIDTLIMQQTNTIAMGDLDLLEGNILYTKKIIQPVMGMAFISHFDWIIDMSRRKVYAKKIKEIYYFENSYRVSIFDTTLQISSLPVDETEYQLFSIIDSVNGEKINADNICQMSELLNKENGFKNNEIVVLPPKSPPNIKTEL